MDLSIPEMEDEMRESLPKDLPLVFISSVINTGIQELKDLLWETLQEENKDVAKQVESFIVIPKIQADFEPEIENE
jgi:GTP-binding protein